METNVGWLISMRIHMDAKVGKAGQTQPSMSPCDGRQSAILISAVELMGATRKYYLNI